MAINRYSFVDYTGKPYIHYFGVANKVLPYQAQASNNSNRSIIRTNQPEYTNYQPYPNIPNHNSVLDR